MPQNPHSVLDDVMQLLTEEDRARIAPLKAAVQTRQAEFSEIDRRRDIAGRRAAEFEETASKLETEKLSEVALPDIDALLKGAVDAALGYSREEIMARRDHNDDVSVRLSMAKNIATALREEEEQCAASAKTARASLNAASRDYYMALASIAADLHDRALWQVMVPLLSYFNSLRSALSRNLEGGTGRLDIVLNQATLRSWENNSFTQVWPPMSGDGYGVFLQRKGVSLTEPAEALDAMVEALSGANPRA